MNCTNEEKSWCLVVVVVVIVVVIVECGSDIDCADVARLLACLLALALLCLIRTLSFSSRRNAKVMLNKSMFQIASEHYCTALLFSS